MGKDIKRKIVVVSIIIVIIIGLTPISSTIGALKSSKNINNSLILRTQYFEQGKLLHSFESKNSLERMKQLEKIIFDMDTAFKEKDKDKIKSCITSLKDDCLIDESLYESCFNLLSKSGKVSNDEKIEDKYCLVFAYSNNSLTAYFSEVIIGIILTQIFLKIKEIGFSGEIFRKLANVLYSNIFAHLIRLLFIKPLAPILLLMIYDGFVYSLGTNGFGAMNAKDYDIGIGATIGPFSGITIDIITPDEEYMYITKFLFIFGISGMVLVGEIFPFP
jgi:hypothetical protein